MPICGFLIAYLGWESVFYVTGAIGLVWSVAWFFLIFDSPRQHPRITIEERQYIEDSIGSTSTTKVRSKSTYASNSIRYLSLFLVCSGCPFRGNPSFSRLLFGLSCWLTRVTCSVTLPLSINYQLTWSTSWISTSKRYVPTLILETMIFFDLLHRVPCFSIERIIILLAVPWQIYLRRYNILCGWLFVQDKEIVGNGYSKDLHQLR